MQDVLAGWSLRVVAAALIAFALFWFGAAIWRYGRADVERAVEAAHRALSGPWGGRACAGGSR